MEKCGLRYARTFYSTSDDPLPGAEQGEGEGEICREDWVKAQGTSVEW